MRRASFLPLLASLTACAAAETPVAPSPTRDAQVDTGPRDTGVRDTGVRDVLDAAVDRAAPMDVAADVVATDAPIDTTAIVDAGVTDTGPSPDRPDVWIFDAGVTDTGPADTGARDVPPVMLGDAYEPPRDGFDTTVRDADITVGTTPTNPAGRFGGAEDSTRAPSIVYPAEGVVMPPNLTGFEVHFLAGTGNDLFEVAFAGDRGTLRMYTACNAVGGGCALSLDERAYGELARVAQPSGRVVLTIRGTSASAAGRFGRSASRTISITGTDVRGGLYYWNAGGSILRFEFGRAGARPENFLRGDPINCLGCHVLSRDGSRTMVGRFIPGPAISRVFDVPTRTPLSAEYGANFGTFSPDNTRLLTSDGARMALLNGATFATTTGLPADNRGSMPDWSRNGRMVVFSRQRNGIALLGQPGHNAPGDLLLMQWNGSAFTTPTTLVNAASNENNYYPSFAPDDQWIVFNRSGGSSYNAIDAHLWAVRASGGSPVRLAAADATGDVGNSWPKFAPFIHTWQGEPLLWVTFSSRRDYGLRLQQQSRAVESRTAQLWMAALRPNRTGDPSAAAFWLPFQDLNSGNHIGQWAQEVQRMGCRSDADCNLQERCLPVGVTSAVYGCVPR